MLIWSINSVALPCKLGECLLFEAHLKLFHWKCFYGKLQFKTEQLFIFTKRLSPICGILCPFCPGELCPKQSAFWWGHAIQNTQGNSKCGSFSGLSLTAEVQRTKISNWRALWNLVWTENPAWRGQWRYRAPQGIVMSKCLGLQFDKIFFKSQGKNQQFC